MDSNDLERERGITILSKNTSVTYKDAKINIIDTSGHYDFGGEVERILNTVDGILLVVDSVEGPMPHTRFVLKKALEFGNAVVVIVNKIDSSSAHPEFSVYSTFELFIELNATDEQLCLGYNSISLFSVFYKLGSYLELECDFQVIYASGIKGKDGLSPENLGDDLGPLFESITRCIPEPRVGKNGSLQTLVTSTESEGTTQVKYKIPTRGLLGLRNAILTASRGTAILNTVFDCYGPWAGDMITRDLGSLVAFEGGTSTSYAMLNI
ncbi:hypothetical protein P8452_01821 [Trifolium repens]|nr:hypothetical protein P8452_01821 [Trifolium repens]